MTHHNRGITNSDIADSTGRFSILSQVHEGMGVYDVQDNHIGSVAFVHFGAASETQQELGTGPASPAPADNPQMREDSLVDNLIEAWDPTELPEELRERLLLSGYVRLDTAGLFASDRFITPEQIARVDDDKVFLSVDRDGLVKKN